MHERGLAHVRRPDQQQTGAVAGRQRLQSAPNELVAAVDPSALALRQVDTELLEDPLRRRILLFEEPVASRRIDLDLDHFEPRIARFVGRNDRARRPRLELSRRPLCCPLGNLLGVALGLEMLERREDGHICEGHGSPARLASQDDHPQRDRDRLLRLVPPRDLDLDPAQARFGLVQEQQTVDRLERTDLARQLGAEGLDGRRIRVGAEGQICELNRCDDDRRTVRVLPNVQDNLSAHTSDRRRKNKARTSGSRGRSNRARARQTRRGERAPGLASPGDPTAKGA